MFSHCKTYQIKLILELNKSSTAMPKVKLKNKKTEILSL